MHNVLRKRRPTDSGTAIQPTSSKRQRFIDATKMLLDIAKESADVLPPLKSCLGGINALIKHYEQSENVQEEVGDLIPWLIKLKDIVTTASVDGNHEGVERREQLIQSLEKIEKQFVALSGKGKVARILDGTRDSKKIIELIKQLQQAILVYQLSQQQSIGNQVAQLTTSFNAFLKFSEVRRVDATPCTCRVSGGLPPVLGAQETGILAMMQLSTNLPPLQSFSLILVHVTSQAGALWIRKSIAMCQTKPPTRRSRF